MDISSTEAGVEGRSANFVNEHHELPLSGLGSRESSTEPTAHGGFDGYGNELIGCDLPCTLLCIACYLVYKASQGDCSFWEKRTVTHQPEAMVENSTSCGEGQSDVSQGIRDVDEHDFDISDIEECD